MSANDWYGSDAASPRELAERIVREAVRRAKLEAKNDPNFVPASGDATNILSYRHFVVQPPPPERPSSDVNDVLASRVFARPDASVGQGTPLNVPWSLVQRDSNGDFAASTVQVVALTATTGATYDFAVFAPDGTTYILRVPTGTQNLEALGSLTVATGFGCNGKTAQTAVAAGAAAASGTGGAGTVAGAAGAIYTVVEQGLINSLISTLNAQAAILNALAAVVTGNATTFNTSRTALIADGILY